MDDCMAFSSGFRVGEWGSYSMKSAMESAERRWVRVCYFKYFANKKGDGKRFQVYYVMSTGGETFLI